MENIKTENDVYHLDVNRIGKSGLDLIHRSPMHYWAKYLDPLREREEKTKALIQGSLIHTAILEPHKLQDEYCIAPKVDRRTTKGKDDWNTFMLMNAGKQAIEEEDFRMSICIKNAVAKHPTASALLNKPGAVEQPIFWTMPVTLKDGTSMMINCKAKPDKLTDDGFILDPKSTDDASMFKFGRSAFNYRYHVQAAWYTDGYTAVYGKPPQAFVFIAIEKTAPYGIAVYYADEETIQLGRKAYMEDLQVYAESLRSGLWPCYPVEIQSLSFPKFAFEN
jgi:hypothetical protein